MSDIWTHSNANTASVNTNVWAKPLDEPLSVEHVNEMYIAHSVFKINVYCKSSADIFFSSSKYILFKKMEANHSDCNKTLNSDPEETRLREEYEQLTAKLHKQKLILSVMKNIDTNSIKDVDEIGKKNIGQALNFVIAFDYLKMDSSGTNVLGKLHATFFDILEFHQNDKKNNKFLVQTIICRHSRQAAWTVLCWKACA